MPFMAMSEATKINSLGLEKFCLLYAALSSPFHADRFDVRHDLLQHFYALHGHVRGHQDHHLAQGVLEQVNNLLKSTKVAT